MQQISLKKLRLHVVTGRVDARDGQRRRADVGDEDATARAQGRKGESQRAAAAADIRDCSAEIRRGKFERQLEQLFGLRAWDEHRRRDVKVAIEEGLATTDVGQRLAVSAARDQSRIAQRLRLGERRVAVGQQPGALPPGDMRQQQLRVQRGRVAAVQALRRRAQGRGNVAHGLWKWRSELRKGMSASSTACA